MEAALSGKLKSIMIALRRRKFEILGYIPARSGSKRIPNKNIRNFLGKPLIAYTIEHAKESPLIGRIIVDTDSPKIAAIARKYGAEVPFLRPKRLAGDTAKVDDAIYYTLNRLEREEGYRPTHFVFLQTTAPLREPQDIEECWALMQKTGADTVLTVAPTHPKLYNLGPGNRLILVNRERKNTENTQEWRPAYLLNGCIVYIVRTAAFLRQRRVFTKNIRAVVNPKWRSVDLDAPEEWALAELIYKNRKAIARSIRKISHGAR